MSGDKIAKWMTAVGAVTVPIIAIIVYVTDVLPSAERMRSAFNDECTEMGIATTADVDKNAQIIVTTLVNYRKNEETVRNQVYREAFEWTQKGEGGYIERIEGRYSIPDNWKENEKALLITEGERDVIEKCFNKHKEEDLYSLMYLVLSDGDMITELERPGAYDIELYKPYRMLGNNTTLEADEKIKIIQNDKVVTKKTVRYLTPYEKIGIIGAYISDLKQISAD